jgi:hypothetical protein
MLDKPFGVDARPASGIEDTAVRRQQRNEFFDAAPVRRVILEFVPVFRRGQIV